LYLQRQSQEHLGKIGDDQFSCVKEFAAHLSKVLQDNIELHLFHAIAANLHPICELCVECGSAELLSLVLSIRVLLEILVETTA
jgi:hypothetical protein